MRYALKDHDRFEFLCVSESQDEFRARVQKLYKAWCVLRTGKGIATDMDTFLTHHRPVQITVTPMSIGEAQPCSA